LMENSVQMMLFEPEALRAGWEHRPCSFSQVD